MLGLTEEQFVKAMEYLLYEHEPETPEEIDAFLRAEGLDPEAISQRGAEYCRALIKQIGEKWAR